MPKHEDEGLNRIRALGDKYLSELDSAQQTRASQLKELASTAVRNAASSEAAAMLGDAHKMLKEAKGLAKGLQDQEKQVSSDYTTGMHKRMRTMTDSAIAKINFCGGEKADASLARARTAN